MGEFGLIARLRAATTSEGSGLALGIGDDAAVIDVPEDRQLVVSTDTLNEGVHFLPGADPAGLGHKVLAVSLSDLAAMGADPRWALLNLSLPSEDDGWLDAFAGGFRAMAGAAGVVLAGGDTTRGPLSLTATALGLVPDGRALTRSGARAGDLVAVSGTLGDAALALRTLACGATPSEFLHERLDRPTPRTALGRRLAGNATACIDLSDGLAADLEHILTASGRATGSTLGARIELAWLPATRELAGLAPGERWALQTGGGDDYELCFTLDPAEADGLEGMAGDVGVPLTVIGQVTAGAGVEWIGPDGPVPEPAAGYEHFSGGARP